MNDKLSLKIVALLLAYDYGCPERGPSLEKTRFFPALSEASEEVLPFWLEENGFPGDIEGMNAKIRDFVAAHRPDCVFTVLMHHEISDDTLDFLRGNSFLVNWFCDDQWRFDDYSRFVAPHLSGVITVDPFSPPKYRSMGIENVFWAPWGVEWCVPAEELSEKQYDYDVSFVGSADRNRRWFVGKLQGLIGRQIACFGAGWPNGRLSQDEARNVFLRSKVNLNLSNSRNTDVRFFFSSPGNASSFFRATKNCEQLKARNIEIPAAGGFELSVYSPGLERYFSIGEEIDIFCSPEDAALKVDYYLANDDVRESLKQAGAARAREYGLSRILRDALVSLGARR